MTFSMADIRRLATWFLRRGDKIADSQLSSNVALENVANTFAAAQTVSVIDAGTTNQLLVQTLHHGTSGTPAAGFGVTFSLTAESTANDARGLASLIAYWVTATDASRKARVSFFVNDTAAREALRLEASGTAPMVGFLGAAAVARPTVTGSRGGNAALASLLTALASLGLITDSTTA